MSSSRAARDDDADAQRALAADVAVLTAHVAVLEAANVAQAAQLAHQGALLLRLQARLGPRDRADVQLLAAIAEAAAGLPFRSSDVMRRGALVPALAEALRDADIVSPRQLGKLLARCEGTVVNGVRLDRGRLRDGAFYWQLVQASEV